MTPTEGSPAPGFTLPDQHGQEVSLAEWRGEKNVVVVFYPYAFSRVCTGELAQIRDSLHELSGPDRALVAISCDPMFGLRVFAERERLTFPLLSDFWPHGAVASAYGVFDEQRGCARRATFVVDRHGIIRWRVQNAMPEARTFGDYAAVLESLG